MKLPIYNKLELAGLTIVLVATAFQLTWLAQLDNYLNEAPLVRIDEKLNVIWNEVRDSDVSEEERGMRTRSFISWIPESEVRRSAKLMGDMFSGIYAIVMVFGSGFLLWGRYLEMVSVAKGRKNKP